MASNPTTNHLTESDCEQILNLFNVEPVNQNPRQTLIEAILDGTIPSEQLGSPD